MLQLICANNIFLKWNASNQNKGRACPMTDVWSQICKLKLVQYLTKIR